ncbi:MAG: TetR/AcrR family transcriptional repressor of nem operon [Parasphingorhabdus sp.]|jgi:TetR/AcrR family transcriptional repressor of nem operon
MPRPIEFNRNQVLESAMQVFWSQGYQSTSMRDLVLATGLQPGSLYGAFKSKHELFRSALERYEHRIDGHVEKLLSGELSPINSIRRFFDSLITQCLNDHAKRGCLMVNTLLEMPAADKVVSQQVSALVSSIEQAFFTLLMQARESGELSSERCPDVLSKVLTSGILGLRVYNKSNPSPDELKVLVTGILCCLDR